ncbi:MAG TPA: hypothetical protein V6D13_02180 [Halomicronema sp.]
MLEKVILATAITFLLNLLLGLSVPSSVTKTNLQLNWLPQSTPPQPLKLAVSEKSLQL